MRLPVTPQISTKNGVANQNGRLTNMLREKDKAVIRPGLREAFYYLGVGAGLIPFNNVLVPIFDPPPTVPPTTPPIPPTIIVINTNYCIDPVTGELVACNLGLGPIYGPPGRPQPPTATVAPLAAVGSGEAKVVFGLGPTGFTLAGAKLTAFTVISNPAGGVDAYAGTTGGVLGTPPNQGAVSRIITGLDNIEYTFTATQSNILGTSDPSDPSNPVTPITVPNAPTIGTATAGNAQATVAYTAPADDGGSAITGYTATSSPGGLTGTGASPITVSGLTNYTSYTFTVTATNAMGTGAASNASNAVVPFDANGKIYQAFTSDLQDFYGNAVTNNGAIISSNSMTSGGAAGAYCTVSITNIPANSTAWSDETKIRVSSVVIEEIYACCNVRHNTETYASALAVVRWNGSNTFIDLQLSSDGLSNNIFFGSVNIAASNVISDGNQHTFTTTFDGSNTRKIYWDGVLKGTYTGGCSKINTCLPTVSRPVQFINNHRFTARDTGGGA